MNEEIILENKIKTVFLTPLSLKILEKIRLQKIDFNLSRFLRIALLRYYISLFENKEELVNELKKIINDVEKIHKFEIVELKTVLGEDVFKEIENEIFNKVIRGAGKGYAP